MKGNLNRTVSGTLNHPHAPKRQCHGVNAVRQGVPEPTRGPVKPPVLSADALAKRLREEWLQDLNRQSTPKAINGSDVLPIRGVKSITPKAVPTGSVDAYGDAITKFVMPRQGGETLLRERSAYREPEYSTTGTDITQRSKLLKALGVNTTPEIGVDLMEVQTPILKPSVKHSTECVTVRIVNLLAVEPPAVDRTPMAWDVSVARCYNWRTRQPLF